MIATGLLWHHWQAFLAQGYSAIAAIFLDSGKPFFDQILSGWRTPNRVNVDALRQSTYSYQGAQATDSLQTSIWDFSMCRRCHLRGRSEGSWPCVAGGCGDWSKESMIQKLQSGIFKEDVR